jgi:hypothetical protein
MKKTILAVAFFATYFISNAQESTSKIKFGAKAGLNISSASVKRAYNTDISPLVGIHVGGFANFKFNKKWAVQSELLYSTQGFKEYDNDGGYIYDEKLKLTYINLPLLLQYQLASKFHVEAGPQVDFLLSGKADAYYYDPMFNTSKTYSDIDVKKFYKSISFGFSIGAGYAFTPRLSSSIRYNLGLSEAEDYPDTKKKNRNLQISLSYSLN